MFSSFLRMSRIHILKFQLSILCEFIAYGKRVIELFLNGLKARYTVSLHGVKPRNLHCDF